MGKSRAYEMIAIADGTKTLEEIREDTGRRRDETRARQREASAPKRKTANSPETKENPAETSKTPITNKGGRPRKPTTREAMQRLIISKLVKDIDDFSHIGTVSGTHFPV